MHCSITCMGGMWMGGVGGGERWWLGGWGAPVGALQGGWPKEREWVGTAGFRLEGSIMSPCWCNARWAAATGDALVDVAHTKLLPPMPMLRHGMCR